MPDPVEILTFTVSDFSGGLCNKKSPMEVAPNQAIDISNMRFITNNLMEKRLGTHPIDNLILTKPILYMDIYKPINKSEVLIRATENAVYADTTKICDVSGLIQGVNYIGNYYFVDGSKIRQYDGTNIYEITEAPHSQLSAEIASGATSMILKSWDARITVDDKIQIEGEDAFHVCTVTAINEATKQITFTPATSTIFAADTFVRLYIPRDESYIEGVWQTDETLKQKWYEPCSLELSDVYKGECYLPVHCTCITLDSERLFLAGDKDNPHSIFMSDINNPYYFPVELGMQCPPNGDKIIDILQFDDSIVVGRKHDINVIGGETNNDTSSSFFVMRQFDTHTGFASKNNARLANNYMFYLGSDMNIYAMYSTQYSDKTLSTTMLNKDTIDLKLAPISLTYTDVEYAPSAYFEDEYYIAVKGKVLVYSYITKGWTVYNGMNATCFLVKDNQLLIGTSTGKVMYMGGEYNDDGVSIDAYYKTGDNQLGKPLLFKDFLDMYAVTHTFEIADSGVTLTSLVDWFEANGEFDIHNQISRFGITKFGEILISKNIAQTDNIPINARGRNIAFVFSNNVLNEPMRIYQISGTYKLRGVR
jgi:hypothetical protein